MATAPHLPISPMDAHNTTLLQNTHPPDWVNPTPAKMYNLVVIGGGTAGLVSAMGAAMLGAKTALIERNLLGGDCLVTGCVPSKALIRSARVAALARNAEAYGIMGAGNVDVDFGAVMARLRRLRADISHHDAAKRFADAGVDVFLGDARFTDGGTIVVDDKTLRFKRAAIATGARATALPIEGLSEAGFLTNETLFNLTERPRRIAAIGTGPIGCEMAQALARLGCEVTVLEIAPQVLPREDKDAAEIVQAALARDGVRFLFNCKTERVSVRDGAKVIDVEVDGTRQSIIVDEILIAVGRQPNVENMGLESAGVKYGKQGIEVDDYLQTSNPNIYAAGDCCMQWKFTHAADAAARILIQNTLFSVGGVGRKKLSDLVMPWCTYTDPEIAHVGLYAKEAEEKGIEVDTYTIELSEVDRAVVESEIEGFARVHVEKGKDKIVGATIVAANAGDMISEVTVAMVNGIGLSGIGKAIHPYPTQAEVLKKLAGEHDRKKLTPTARKWLGRWMAWRR